MVQIRESHFYDESNFFAPDANGSFLRKAEQKGFHTELYRTFQAGTFRGIRLCIQQCNLQMFYSIHYNRLFRFNLLNTACYFQTLPNMYRGG